MEQCPYCGSQLDDISMGFCTVECEKLMYDAMHEMEIKARHEMEIKERKEQEYQEYKEEQLHKEKLGFR